uniref:Uncharacterized protein n=1 Tax=viral metagenome TaxID=1070528 RepID=A0A6C0L9S0_9ZZZZ
MGGSFSKFKEDRRKFMPSSSEKEEDEKNFAIKSRQTALILRDKNAENIVKKQDTEEKAKILAAAEVERSNFDEELMRTAKNSSILNDDDIRKLQDNNNLSTEDFKKKQEEQIRKQVKINQEERREKVMKTLRKNSGGGGNNKNKPIIIVRKEILGKERCIYKKTGDRKEYVKYKSNLITVKDYKKIIKARNNKKI